MFKNVTGSRENRKTHVYRINMYLTLILQIFKLIFFLVEFHYLWHRDQFFSERNFSKISENFAYKLEQLISFRETCIWSVLTIPHIISNNRTQLRTVCKKYWSHVEIMSRRSTIGRLVIVAYKGVLAGTHALACTLSTADIRKVCIPQFWNNRLLMPRECSHRPIIPSVSQYRIRFTYAKR